MPHLDGLSPLLRRTVDAQATQRPQQTTGCVGVCDSLGAAARESHVCLLLYDCIATEHTRLGGGACSHAVHSAMRGGSRTRTAACVERAALARVVRCDSSITSDRAARSTLTAVNRPHSRVAYELTMRSTCTVQRRPAPLSAVTHCHCTPRGTPREWVAERGEAYNRQHTTAADDRGNRRRMRR